MSDAYAPQYTNWWSGTGSPFRVDSQGVTFGARDGAPEELVPWDRIESVVHFDAERQDGTGQPCVGVLLVGDTPPLARLRPQEVLGWDLDLERLTAAVHAFAPDVPVQRAPDVPKASWGDLVGLGRTIFDAWQRGDIHRMPEPGTPGATTPPADRPDEAAPPGTGLPPEFERAMGAGINLAMTREGPIRPGRAAGCAPGCITAIGVFIVWMLFVWGAKDTLPDALSGVLDARHDLSNGAPREVSADPGTEYRIEVEPEDYVGDRPEPTDTIVFTCTTTDGDGEPVTLPEVRIQPVPVGADTSPVQVHRITTETGRLTVACRWTGGFYPTPSLQRLGLGGWLGPVNLLLRVVWVVGLSALIWWVLRRRGRRKRSDQIA